MCLLVCTQENKRCIASCPSALALTCSHIICTQPHSTGSVPTHARDARQLMHATRGKNARSAAQQRMRAGSTRMDAQAAPLHVHNASAMHAGGGATQGIKWPAPPLHPRTPHAVIHPPPPKPRPQHNSRNADPPQLAAGAQPTKCTSYVCCTHCRGRARDRRDSWTTAVRLRTLLVE